MRQGCTTGKRTIKTPKGHIFSHSYDSSVVCGEEGHWLSASLSVGGIGSLMMWRRWIHMTQESAKMIPCPRCLESATNKPPLVLVYADTVSVHFAYIGFDAKRKRFSYNTQKVHPSDYVDLLSQAPVL